MAEPGERRLTFSLCQLATDPESTRKERADHINRIVNTREAGNASKNSVDIWRKSNIGNANDVAEIQSSNNENEHILINSSEDTEQSGAMRKCFNCFLRLLGGKAVIEARFSLFMIIFDWVIDFSVGLVHLYKERWLPGGLTFLIVFGAGCIVTFANFSPHELDASEINSEIWKMGKFYGVLMYIPSFYPIVTTKLRLHFTKKLTTVENEEDKKEIARKHDIVEEKALWDMCCESTFEAIPQAVLQIVIVFDRYYKEQIRTKATTGENVMQWFDFLPILSILLSVNGISMAPITFMRSRSSDFVLKLGERLTAYSTQALRVLCSGLFIIGCRRFLATESLLLDAISTVLLAIVIFAIFDVPYIVRHELEKRNTEGSSLQTINKVIDVVFFVATFGSFQLWVFSWLNLVSEYKTQFVITVTISVTLMALTYFGLFYYRLISVHYRDIAASVIVYAYDAAKTWILSVFGVRSKRDQSIAPVL